MSAGVPAADEARSALDDLLAAAILVVDGRDLTGRDLLAAGVVSGRWQQLERQLSDGLGLAAAEPPPDGDVTVVLRAFRLERGLLAGEDLKAWMHARGLTLAAVKAVAARRVARERGGAPQPVAVEQVAAALSAEAICTGALREIGLWLADRMLSAATSGAGVEPISPERTAVQRLVFEEARTVAGSASPESGVERAERLGWIAALDAAHREWEADVTATEAVARKLHEKELDWCRFELDELRLDSAGAAAEAARQLVEGADPNQVAATAGAPLTTQSVVLADVPPEQAQVLLGAVAGDLVGPWSESDGYGVARVRDRQVPALGDERIVARAHEELLTDAATRLRAGRVRWHDRT